MTSDKILKLPENLALLLAAYQQEAIDAYKDPDPQNIEEANNRILELISYLYEFMTFHKNRELDLEAESAFVSDLRERMKKHDRPFTYELTSIASQFPGLSKFEGAGK